jgi:transcriptional regulator with XRE-family HTH domain
MDTTYDAVVTGANIRFARKAKRWTQEDLAGAAGVHVITVVRLEKGRQVAKIETLLSVADALGVTLAWLCSPHDGDKALGKASGKRRR